MVDYYYFKQQVLEECGSVESTMKVREVRKILQSCVETENATEKNRVIYGTEVTHIWEGTTDDEDCFGNTGHLEPGDVQWVTAGRGLVHARMPTSEEPVVGLQVWLNLPRKDKMAGPMSQELRASEIPRSEQDGVSVAVLCGEALTTKVSTKTSVLYLDISLQPGTQHIQPGPSGWITVIYVLCGTLQISQFVMMTEGEIAQAIEDHERCTNGFERALNWKSKLCELVRIH